MNETFLLIVIFVFGTMIGSFLNVVIYRLPRGKSVVFPSSHCTSCGYKIKWYENIPVFSYIFLKGRCKNCKTPISMRYPLIEVLTGFSAVAVYLKSGFSIESVFYFIFLCLIISIIFIDIDFRIIPDELNLIGFLTGLTFSLFREDFSILDAVIGSVVGAGFLYVVAYLYLKLRGIEGLGLGDVKMLAFVGTYLGWFGSLFTIFFGSVLGVLLGVGISLLKKKKYEGQLEIPFGPFLGVASVVYLFFGEKIKDFYFGGMM
ncbi:MAG: prepilin peptidase [Aquificae bacterium]|nr:prepilin peptidase [Aquificota bacterium]